MLCLLGQRYKGRILLKAAYNDNILLMITYAMLPYFPPSPISSAIIAARTQVSPAKAQKQGGHIPLFSRGNKVSHFFPRRLGKAG